ncbi:hypothetical protein F5Y10DRAFT_286418 [Nemania abortiva]|nr:hypothetical protein F5Y10DRAFT_286418 [Nemania abortiva]
MSAARHHVFLFGDQTDNVTGCIKDLYMFRTKSVLLAKFLQDASDACKTQFGNLQPCFRGETPPFESLLELAENLAETDGSPVLAACAVSYFARLGDLILRAEYDPTILSSPRVLIGLCINLFPAALAATAKSATELAHLSLEGFPSFFNWVVTNHARSKQIEWPHGSWSCLVYTKVEDFDVKELMEPLLDMFHKTNNTPKHKRAWIGVFGRGWVTVSGPPSTLKQLMMSTITSEDNELFFRSLPVASAVHAPHLPMFKCVIEDSDIWDMPLQEGAWIMSTSDCVPFSAKTLRGVVQELLRAVLNEPLMVDGTFKATAEYLTAEACVNTAAVSFLGPSALAPSLLETLKEAGIRTELLLSPACEIDQRMKPGPDAVAIVGMSVDLPRAGSLEEFWDLLVKGHTTHETIPPDRFNLAHFFDPTGDGKNTMMNTDGCFLSDPGDFDPRLFKISPKEALQIDPTHRLLLMASLEALERAGYNPDASLPSQAKRTAVYFGQNADVWREINAEQGVSVFTAPGILRAFSPGRVSHHFGFQGGTYNVDSACSSSATAIQLACAALANKDCDMALAGGAQVLASPFEFAALGKSGFLAPSGGCKTFRADANGYCRGEGVGVVVLKRLDDALANNDKIEALITGWGRNYSAGTSSMTRPHSESQQKLIRQVLRQANAKPADIGYVELHGTGTTVGDLAEMETITKIFGQNPDDSITYVGSVKANVGHSESAAGVTSVIKAALMLKEGVIPRQAMITPGARLQPLFDEMDTRLIYINDQPAAVDNDKEKILVNSFDAAGGNTCLLIERAPKLAEADSELDTRGWYSVTLSAQTSNSLRGNQHRLWDYLLKHPEVKLSDVAYSMSARRSHYDLRAEYTVESIEQLVEQLDKDARNPSQTPSPVSEKPRVVFLFNGQGSSYYGIAEELYKSHAGFREHIDVLNELCEDMRPNVRVTVKSLLTKKPEDTDRPSVIEEHLAIVCFQIALAELWKSWGVEPDIVLGHSIGEYGALSIAGVLSAADTLWLVAERAKLFEATFPDGEYGMLSLAATADEVRDLLRHRDIEDTCSIACFNSDKSHVVGGPTADLRQLEIYATSSGVPMQSLAMSHASHSKPTERIHGEIKDMAVGITFFPPRTPVCSTVTGEIVTRNQVEVFNPWYIARHACEPVNFMRAVKATEEFLAGKRDSTLWVEIGPGSTCLTLLRQTLDVRPSQLLQSIHRSDSNWETLTRSLGRAYVAGSPVNWPEFHRPFAEALNLINLPTYHFDLQRLWWTYTKATASASGIETAKGGAERHKYLFTPTATVHKISHRDFNSETAEVKFVSSLENPRLRDAIKGHRIEGNCVCPASVFIDMAFTAAAYVWNVKLPGKTKRLGSLENLELCHPFVLREDSKSQVIEIRVQATKEKDWNADVWFSSHSGNGEAEEIGYCQVLTKTNRTTGDEWVEMCNVVGDQIKGLINSAADVSHLRDDIFYKLYGTTVKYGSRYHGIVDAFLKKRIPESENYEGVAEVKLTATPEEEHDAFMLSPYHIDALVHIAGFGMNIEVPGEDIDALSFVSGIGSVTLLEELSEENTYRTYFCPIDYSGEKNHSGRETFVNIYIFNQDKVIGVVDRIRFCKIKRQALKFILQQAQFNADRSSARRTGKLVLRSSPPIVNVAPQAKEPSQPSSGKGKVADAFISALMAETGAGEYDVRDETKLSELGVDSLMQIAIIRRIKTDANLTLPMSMFSNMRTIRDVRDRLSPHDGTERNSQGSIEPPSSAVLDLTARYSSNAVLLHGDQDSSKRPLILIAGSGGSASVYAQLPPLPSSTPVWALESPFLDCPSEMVYTPQDIAPIYALAVKAIQPTGPYLLGGYSAGAVHAYEVARLLMARGEKVQKLIIIDMKAHIPGETWHDQPRVEDVTMLNTVVLKNVPDEKIPITIERLFASLMCMYNWKPIPMEPRQRPQNGTVVIWARRGLCQRVPARYLGFNYVANPIAAENKDYKAWFWAPRYVFYANGWDTLVGDVETHSVGGDHWTILGGVFAREVVRLIDEAIATEPNATEPNATKPKE